MRLKEYAIASAVALDTKGHYAFLTRHIRSAKRRVYASVFIVDPRVLNDEDLLVRDLIRELSAAARRRMDVKILHGGSAVTDIFVGNYVAHHFLRAKSIPT